MSLEEISNRHSFRREDHQVAFLFDPSEGEEDEATEQPSKSQQQEQQQKRPAKRRRVSKQVGREQNEEAEKGASNSSLFPTLFDGKETRECVIAREELFGKLWGRVERKIQDVLKNSNSATLEEVGQFMDQAGAECVDQIPCALIITGPNIASQDLLFRQLSRSLTLPSSYGSSETTSRNSRYVKLLSSDCSNLKATLKKIIRDATRGRSGEEEEEWKPNKKKKKTGQDEGDEEDEDEVEQEDMNGAEETRRYLDYDLDALYAHVKANMCDHVVVAFQDSEGFDSGLLSELIQLLHSWRPRIPFTLLFGIATSVDLLQARLLKSAASLIYGAQFDVEQSGTILEAVFKVAVAGPDVPVKPGPRVLREMLDRQQDQVAGIQAFVSSLKYAYMCHFYANPLSILTSPSGNDDDEGGGDIETLIQVQHTESLRNLPSFQSHIEDLVEKKGDGDSLQDAKRLLEDDDSLLAESRALGRTRRQWHSQLSRALAIMEAAGAQAGTYSDAFVEALAHGVHLSDNGHLVGSVRRMSAEELAIFLAGVVDLLQGEKENGDADGGSEAFLDLAGQAHRELAILLEEAGTSGHRLRSRYSKHSTITRTTVIAQKVQLSQDKAALREEDQRFTEVVDRVTGMLLSHVPVRPVSEVLFSEVWVFDSPGPLREVFVPRPRRVFERGLSRPHDYLACSCCRRGRGRGRETGTGTATEGGEGGEREGEGGEQGGQGEGILGTLPATSILYQLYKDTGSLINVADLWTAFQAIVEEQVGGDERKALVLFYRGLAELRSLGYVKAGSRTKTDHVAKVKWL